MLFNDFTGPARFRLNMPEVALEMKRVWHPCVTSCYQVHALNPDAHLSAALLWYLGATGAETSLLLTVYCIE